MPDPAPAPDPGTPRWVKVFAIIALIVVLALIILMVTGVHGPPAGGHR